MGLVSYYQCDCCRRKLQEDEEAYYVHCLLNYGQGRMKNQTSLFENQTYFCMPCGEEIVRCMHASMVDVRKAAVGKKAGK